MIEVPLGHCIIDGLGGIRDAAIKGAEMYLNRLGQEKTEQHPEKSSKEIMEEALPGVAYTPLENGEASLAFDIRLKKLLHTFQFKKTRISLNLYQAKKTLFGKTGSIICIVFDLELNQEKTQYSQ